MQVLFQNKKVIGSLPKNLARSLHFHSDKQRV